MLQRHTKEFVGQHGSNEKVRREPSALVLVQLYGQTESLYYFNSFNSLLAF